MKGIYFMISEKKGDWGLVFVLYWRIVGVVPTLGGVGGTIADNRVNYYTMIIIL